MAINEPIQTSELEPLLVELEDLQPIEFELVNNHLTHGSIKGIEYACSLLPRCACS